mmetsp:Transcript_5575/g.9799  ORF Transcript_5575/g.9799 Transcript_5575/m.9799 type:complete len:106 (+) Transcript_5575:953-1270(+)
MHGLILLVNHLKCLFSIASSCLSTCSCVLSNPTTHSMSTTVTIPTKNSKNPKPLRITNPLRNPQESHSARLCYENIVTVWYERVDRDRLPLLAGTRATVRDDGVE